MTEYVSKKNNITKKDFTKIFWLSFLMQANFTYMKMQGVGFCIAIQHVLRKIWTDDADYQKALQRHLAPFNMTVAPAPLIMGISIAMEEKAKELGANGIIGLKISYNNLGGTMGNTILVTVYGTAVSYK